MRVAAGRFGSLRVISGFLGQVTREGFRRDFTVLPPSLHLQGALLDQVLPLTIADAKVGFSGLESHSTFVLEETRIALTRLDPLNPFSGWRRARALR
jgi:hypothetical protein